MADIKNETAKRPNGVYGFPFRGFRVIVHNLEQSVSWRDLKDFLRMAGEVRFADVIVPGTGIGEFGTPQERANVVRKLNGKELKGNKVIIKNLNELDPRYGSPRPVGRFHLEGTGFHPPHCDPPFGPGFEPFFNGAPTVSPIEYPPFGPPPPRMPWGVSRGGGRMYPPMMPPFPPTVPFARGMVRPDVNTWMPPAPPRPPPVRGFERPAMVYSQPPPPIRAPEYTDHREEPTYPRTVPNFPEAPMYETRPETTDYRAYRYQDVRDKDYQEEWNYRREPDGVYGYDPPPSGEKAVYSRDDSRGEYPDYISNHSTGEDRRKGHARSGYGYVEEPYPKSNDPVGYAKGRADEYEFHIEEYTRDGYPKDHREYEHPRSEARSYEYEREAGYYERRDHDRGYREDDPRGAGGIERNRPRSQRLGPYDR